LHGILARLGCPISSASTKAGGEPVARARPQPVARQTASAWSFAFSLQPELDQPAEAQ